MPVALLVDPRKVIAFLEARGWRVLKRTEVLAGLVHPEFDCAVIVPMHDGLRPSEVRDILWNAGIEESALDDLMFPE